jgi:hypothetical protein
MTVISVAVEVLMVMVMMMNRLRPISTIAPVIISAMVFMVVIVTAVFMAVMVPVFSVVALPIIRQGNSGAKK